MRAVIDIGSNSIRLMIEGEKVKRINTTQLAEGLAISGMLNEGAIKRTADAVEEFYHMAEALGAEKIYPFATEAVRSARNGGEFISHLAERGIKVDLLSTEREAECGFIGAYKGGRAAIFDIGGGSTEIITGNENGLTYERSVPVGIVRLKDLCGQDVKKLESYIEAKLKEFGSVPSSDYAVAIGGTASTVAAVLLGGYDRDKVHNYTLTVDKMQEVLDLIVNAPDRNKIPGLPLMRSTVIIGGIILLIKITRMLGHNSIIVSEEDNMEGYIKQLDLKK